MAAAEYNVVEVPLPSLFDEHGGDCSRRCARFMARRGVLTSRRRSRAQRPRRPRPANTPARTWHAALLNVSDHRQPR